MDRELAFEYRLHTLWCALSGLAEILDGVGELQGVQRQNITALVALAADEAGRLSTDAPDLFRA